MARTGKNNPFWNKKHTQETLDGLSVTLKNQFKNGRKPTAANTGLFGPASFRWKGGTMTYWKKQALLRDDYTCQKCGLYEPEIMEVDHIKPKSYSPELFKKLSNMITLCPNCHARKTKRDIKEGLINIPGRPKKKLYGN